MGDVLLVVRALAKLGNAALAEWTCDPSNVPPAGANEDLVAFLREAASDAKPSTTGAFVSDTEVGWEMDRGRSRTEPREPNARDRIEALVGDHALPALDAEAAALWDVVRGVAIDGALWDSEFLPSPHDTRPARAALVALGERAVAVLVRQLDHRQRYIRMEAIWALAQIGDAGRAATLPLLIHCRRSVENEHSSTVKALCAVNRKLVLRRGMHTSARTRLPVVEWFVENRSSSETKHLLAELLAKDEDNQRFVLFGGDPSMDFKGLVHHPNLVLRLAVVRPLLESPDATVRAGAARVLANLGTPFDSVKAIAIALAAPATIAPIIHRLAQLPESHELVPALVAKKLDVALATLCRARRQAGRSTAAAPMRAFLEETLAQRALYTEDAISVAIDVVAQLDERESFRAAIEATREHPRWYSIDNLPFVLATDGDHESIWKVGQGDARFLAGENFGPSGASASYDRVLLGHPKDAHAAFQLAWIARAFGAPIDDARASFIASLGFHDRAFLALLQTAPAQKLDGHSHQWTPWFAHETTPEAFRARIEKTAASGLPALAARDCATLVEMLQKAPEPTLEPLRLLTAMIRSPSSGEAIDP
ncbi:hypothetical protein BH09MYX1_BH09MYX1_62690 [soil metagenome]